MSVCETEHSPLWTNNIDSTLSMDNFLRDEVKNNRSQDLPKHYRLNGAIYICKISELLKQKTFFLEKNIFAYIMDQERSIDIDTLLDFKMAEFLLKSGSN